MFPLVFSVAGSRSSYAHPHAHARTHNGAQTRRVSESGQPNIHVYSTAVIFERKMLELAKNVNPGL